MQLDEKLWVALAFLIVLAWLIAVLPDAIVWFGRF